MGDEEPATFEGQFAEFSKLFESKKREDTISLYQSDYWMRQANILDDRKLTMIDTGICFNRFSKSEINFEEFEQFLSDLCKMKYLAEDKVKADLTHCGLPGESSVTVPSFREFFTTYKPKIKGVVISKD